ncbi:nuclear transport factor 2 family protein [Salegentibacter sp. HM20]
MSEKEKFIQELNRAFEKGDIEAILESMTDDIEWDMVGGKRHKGKATIKEEMSSMSDFEMIEMQLDKIITHGKLASANGTFKMKEKGQVNSYAFCDVYEFSGFKNPKIKKLTAYVVPINH